MSPWLSLFAASLNLATSQPGHRVFACVLIAPEGLGDESPWKMSAFGSRLFHENFSQFHPLINYPLKKSYFCYVWHGPPSRWPSFEHSSVKMGSLNIELVYSTLRSSITAARSTSKFHFNTFQYSVGGTSCLMQLLTARTVLL